MPGRRTFLLLPLLATALLSCAELPPIEAGRCGNGFIEQGEDCDEFGAMPGKKDPNMATCNVSGEANQCLFHCANDAQCQSTPVSEPGSSWRCGVDQVCRRPLGHQGDATFFRLVSNLIPGGADDLFSGDFDGDGRKDLLAVRPAGFDVHYFTRDGAVAKSLHVPGAPMIPAIGKLTKTDADDFTVDVGQGIGVMLGRPGQTIEPTSYTSLDIKKRYQHGPDAKPADDMSLVIVDKGATIDAGPSMTPVRRGPGLLALSVDGDELNLTDASVDPQKGKLLITKFPGLGAKTLLGTIPVAFPRPGADRQRFLLAFQNEASVYVIDAGAASEPAIKSALDLPPGLTVHGAAFFGYANDDDFVDVFIGAADCSKGAMNCEVAEIDVAYGDGEGDFYSVTKSDPAWGPATLGKVSSYLNVYPKGDPQPNPKPQLSVLEIERYLPLAIGQFNTDPRVDYVNARGIYVSDGGSGIGCFSAPNGYCEVERPSGGQLWSDVKVSDFNANGRFDVAAVSRGNAGVDFFSGTGTGIFNTFSIPTEGTPSKLSVGDYDGDFLPDLAFDSATSHVDERANTLFVAFGRAAGALELPVSMGEVVDLRQILSGNLSSFGNDAASDIVLLSGIPATLGTTGNKVPGGRWKVGLSQGNGYRQLQAPLLFLGKNNIQVDASPLASAIGSFDSDTPFPPATESHADVAAVVQSFKPKELMKMGDPPFCMLQTSLWMLPAMDNAEIEPPTDGGKSIMISTGDKDLPDNFLPVRRFVATAPINLAAGSPQGLLIAFPTYDKCAPDLDKVGAHGKLLLARFDADGQPTLTTLIESVGGEGVKNKFLVRLRVGDINGDTIPDIAALQADLNLSLGQIATTEVVVLLGDGKGSFGPSLTVPNDGVPVDLALVNTDGEGDLELVVVSSFSNVDFSTDLVVVDWDRSTKNGTTPFKNTVVLLSGGDDPTDNHGALGKEQPTALAGGDFDGDGVDDVAVAIVGGIRVFKGVAK